MMDYPSSWKTALPAGLGLFAASKYISSNSRAPQRKRKSRSREVPSVGAGIEAATLSQIAPLEPSFLLCCGPFAIVRLGVWQLHAAAITRHPAFEKGVSTALDVVLGPTHALGELLLIDRSLRPFRTRKG